MIKSKFAIFVLLIMLCGCVFALRDFNEDNLGNICVGMDKEEALEILGSPDDIEDRVVNDENYEVWKYSVERYFAKKYNPLDKLYYEVFLLDDKISKWNKIKIYSQPEHDLEDPVAPEGIKTYEFFKRNKKEE